MIAALYWVWAMACIGELGRNVPLLINAVGWQRRAMFFLYVALDLIGLGGALYYGYWTNL